MKDKLQKLWDKITEGGSVAIGCILMAVIFFGIIWGLVYLIKWIWSFEGVKNLSSNFLDFITEHGDILEYVFVGAFFLFLFGCFIFSAFTFFKDNKKLIVARFKIGWQWFLKILMILALAAICLFCLHECYRNSPDIVPERYERRL